MYVICKNPAGDRFIPGHPYEVLSTDIVWGFDSYKFAHINASFRVELFEKLDVVNIYIKEVPIIGHFLKGDDSPIQYVEYNPYTGNFVVTLTNVADTLDVYLVTLV